MGKIERGKTVGIYLTAADHAEATRLAAPGPVTTWARNAVVAAIRGRIPIPELGDLRIRANRANGPRHGNAPVSARNPDPA